MVGFSKLIRTEGRKEMKTKLGKVEKRAKAYCDRIKETGSGSLTVEWRKSQTWGMNPAICNYNGEKMTNVSGCGYCKHSTALADMLRFLGTTDEEINSIWSKGGSGVDSVIDQLKAIGWDLKRVHWTKTTDTYEINKM